MHPYFVFRMGQFVAIIIDASSHDREENIHKGCTTYGVITAFDCLATLELHRLNYVRMNMVNTEYNKPLAGLPSPFSSPKIRFRGFDQNVFTLSSLAWHVVV